MAVVFTPHRSPSGIKIRLTSGVPAKFADSFAPYKLFGCDPTAHYEHTLFRFPLRSAAAAAVSDIKAQACTPEDIATLFAAFKQTAVMLFLKHVTTVELWEKAEATAEPVLLSCMTMGAGDGEAEFVHPQAAVAKFVRGAESKAQFHRQLMACADGNLPATCCSLQMTTHEPGAASEPVQQQWLACNLLAGGQALQMAVKKGGKRGWVPWAGVAACTTPTLSADGKAFCFLPLPMRTGLPVYVNGFFELSSNRRDLWQGDDLTGSGKDRSLWNVALLAHGVAPAYVQVLLAAAQRLGATAAYWSLWPVQGNNLRKPWTVVADRVLQLVRHVCSARDAYVLFLLMLLGLTCRFRCRL